MKTSLSACILTHNSADSIERAIESVSFCDEILIIDDQSTDETCKVAEKKGAMVIKHALNDDFSAQRMFAITQAKSEYVLFLDSDEEISTELTTSIQSIFTSKEPPAEVYFLCRRDFFWGTELKHGEVQKVRNEGIIRLVKKGSGTFKGVVHEVFVSKKDPKKLKGFINHYPHQTVAEFLQDINRYSTVRARELFAAGVRSVIIVLYPALKFMLTYGIYRGFLDGAAGFAYSFFMSFHSFLVRTKLYQYQRFGLPKK